MTNEIELISDGDGLAIIGDTADVERFLVAEGLNSHARTLPQLDSMLRAGSVAAKAGATIAENSGRWVKMTDKSVELIKKYDLMKGSESGLSRGVVQAKNGQIQGLVEFVKGPASLLTSPAVLAGAGGIMAQMAMQRSMDEINEYLAIIDEKVEDVLRAQKDAALSEMIGVDFVIEEAMTIRQSVGRVSEVTWSKVQATSVTIARTQAYALRQLDALAEKLEKKSSMDDLAKTSKQAEATVQGWLVVLARCFQLQDGLAVLELDRVLDASPEELGQHRVGLREARENRRELISRSTARLMARMDVAAGSANKKVLLHPFDSRSVVLSTNHVAVGVVQFHERLGIENNRETLEAMRWMQAVGETRDRLIETGAEGVDAAGRLGAESLVRVRSVADKVSLRFAEGALRRSEAKQDRAGDAGNPV